MEPDEEETARVGMPRWLIIGFAVKLAILVAITLVVVWYAAR